jgi:hypothetical protein
LKRGDFIEPEQSIDGNCGTALVKSRPWMADFDWESRENAGPSPVHVLYSIASRT